MGRILEYRNCFICGKESQNGLKAGFEITETGAKCTYITDNQFEGFKGVVHGGVLCALLDEVMWKAINAHTGLITMTAKMELKFKKPALIGTKLCIEGFMLRRKKSFIEAKGIITNSEGEVIAEASGLFKELDPESAALMAENLS